MSKRKSPDKLAPKPRERKITLIEAAKKLGLPEKILSRVSSRFKALIKSDHSEEEAARIVLSGVDDYAPTTTEEIIENEKNRRKEAQKFDLIDALKKDKLQSHALYRDPDPWIKVSEDWEYRKRQRDLDTILTKINEIFKIVGHDGARQLRMVEMGPGTGQKDKAIIEKILEQMKLDRAPLGEGRLENFILDLVDVSPEMLFCTFSLILDHIRPKIRSLKSENVTGHHPWKGFKEFLEKSETAQGDTPEYTESPSLAAISVQKAFYKLLRKDLVSHDDRTYVQSLLKFALARYFGLKKSDNKLLYELDRDIDLPFEINPHKGTFEKINGDEFSTTRTVSTCYSHIGNEAMNQFPEITIRDLYANNLLKRTPEVIRETEATGEAKIRATYVMFSFQTDQDGDEAIMDGYDIPSFNHFVSHLFADPNLSTFIDPETSNILTNKKCYRVEASYEEDPDNEGYFGTVHRLVFTRDVNIMVQPDGQAPTIFAKNKGDEIMLLPSYKPSIEQIEDLCEKHGLQIIKEYLNEDETNAVFLIRRKTKEERDAVGRESSSTRAAVADVLEEEEEQTSAGSEAPKGSKGGKKKRRIKSTRSAAKRPPQEAKRKSKKPTKKIRLF